MDNQQMINCAASSSSSSSYSLMPLKKYDVFLSFRGEDVRDNFISHLYDALRKEVETYIDYRLEKGDEISQALIKAIQDSLVSVVIFSENYASSKWCLDEINMILECKKDHGQVVIPVFYKVDPSHVRKQTGSYKEAFAKHERDLQGHGDDKLQKWRNALTDAANLAGFHSQNYRNDFEFIKEIVKDVIKKLNIRYPIELKGVIGIEENYAGIESLLDIGSTDVVRVIAIWGMGGAGKTTLARALHAKLFHQFEGHCFLNNVREQSAEKNGLDSLRNRLFSQLLEEENLPVDSHFVTRRLRRRKVLIVLDDVATSEQLEDLIGDYDSLAPGSRVIVTTRDKHILTLVNDIYEVKELNQHASLQLFCLKAFMEKHPKFGYEELSRSVIEYCKGNPLALKVLGSRLQSRSIEVWKTELRKLHKIQDVKIHNVLKLSFDDLDPTEKDIFLDIACFFKGENRDYITGLLDACDFYATVGIENLIDKSLLTISNYGKIEMHDLIQELGQNIVRQESYKDPGRRSRIWDPVEVYDVLKNNKATDAVEGIILDLSKIKDLNLSFNSLTKMSKIRFLKFYNSNGSEGGKIYLAPNGLESLSNKLRSLEWHGYCLESLPSNFFPEMLVKLDMQYSNLKRLWEGKQNLVNLKNINLWGSKHLVELPDLSMATNLKGLELGKCKSLREVHPSILSHQKLRSLCMYCCTGIKSFEIDVHLKSLVALNLNGCSSLEKLTFFSDLVNASLRSLNLSRMKLVNESYLSLIIDGMRSLTFLSLEDCCNLRAIPDCIGSLTSLEELYLSGCINLEMLSPNIKNLLNLRELRLNNCWKLVSVPELPLSLEILTAINCTSLCTDFFTPLLPMVEHMYNIDSLTLDEDEDEDDFDYAHVIFPGDRIPEMFNFHAEGDLITFPHLPAKSGLRGFMCCLIFSHDQLARYGYVECFFNNLGIHSQTIHLSVGAHSFIKDHVLIFFMRAEDCIDDGKTKEDYHILFEFCLQDKYGSQCHSLNKPLKRCGVYPVYAYDEEHEFQTTSFVHGVQGSTSNNEGDQATKLQLDKIVSAERECKRKTPSFKQEENSRPEKHIIPLDTLSALKQIIQVSKGKDLFNNQVDKCSELVMFEKSHTLVEIDNPHLKPDWDPIGEIKSMLSDRYMVSPMPTTHSASTSESPNLKAILEKLEILLDTSLEMISSNDEVKHQFHHVLEQLGHFEDEVSVRLHPVICKLKTLIEGFDFRFATSQKTIQDYDQLLQSRSLLAKQLESVKAQQDQIKIKVSECKVQLENIHSEIGEQEKESSVLVEDIDRLKRELDYYEAEDSKLKAHVAQWMPECKTVFTALKNSETAYKVAVTNKKKYEDEWAHLKMNFAANKF